MPSSVQRNKVGRASAQHLKLKKNVKGSAREAGKKNALHK